MQGQTLATGLGLAGFSAGIGAGMDFVCAALTLAYISRLLFQNMSIGNPVAVSCTVAKVSLQGQQVARRLR